MTAIREGNEVRITRDALPDAKALSIRCDVKSDACQIVTSEDGEHVAIRIEKTRSYVDGKGDCMTDDIDVIALGAGPLREQTIAIVAADEGRVRLNCPEGDAMLWAERGDTERTFLCPKHEVPLEKR